MSKRAMRVWGRLFLSAALCGPVVAAANQSYLDQIAVMDAQIAIAKKQAELRSALQGLAGSHAGLPQVVSVAGFDPDLSAVVRYPGGRKLTVRKGDRLPGGVEVKTVAAKGVVVRFAKVEAALEFESGIQAGGERQSSPPPELLPPVPRVNVPLPTALLRAPSPAAPTESQPAPAGAGVGSPQMQPAKQVEAADAPAVVAAPARATATGKTAGSTVAAPPLAIEK